MNRYRLTYLAALLILVSVSVAAGCSGDKGTNPYGGDGGGGGGAAPELSSGNFSAGTYSHKFTTAGTYLYHCSLHPNMQGTVIVSASAPAADSVQAVSITNFAFGPNSVTIAVNGRVAWTNNGGMNHTVTSN